MYVKQIELTRFKSFGATTTIPLLPGFTVISGPNGSGKSNILDALLFALGLSSSKGMRADRLPDLVNQSHSQKGRTVESSVAVTFAVDEEVPTGEWTISRKLRVTSQGTYTSTYYVNGSPCTLSELHEQLAKFHVYPEGYNVVLQGDVTGIISMNARERREIIDELAGVGEFDRKIETAKEKLDDVKTQEDRFRIVEQELKQAQEKLQGDRAKAEKYQALRHELSQLDAAELVLAQRHWLYQRTLKEEALRGTQQAAAELQQELSALQIDMDQTAVQYNELNARVHDLGESEYVQQAGHLAAKQAELKSLQKQQQELMQSYDRAQQQLGQTQTEINDLQRLLEQVVQQQQHQRTEIKPIQELGDRQQALVHQQRQDLSTIATASAEWLKQQAKLYQSIEDLQTQVDPLRQEQIRLQESVRQWWLQRTQAENDLEALGPGNPSTAPTAPQVEIAAIETQIQGVSQALSDAQMEVQVLRETTDRLGVEHQQKTRQLDRLDAQVQSQRETFGTKAVQVIRAASLRGIHGLVAELGKVEPKVQLALEIAAGNRLGFLVVEDDEVAAEAINLLKLERAGRATFLPLNKLKSFNLPWSHQGRDLGAIDYAVNLVQFASEYQDVFGFIFGQTLVYAHLEEARRHIGRHRMVTLEGDLLEATGAMTGGSQPSSHSLHFGTTDFRESQEAKNLRDRLQAIDQMLQQLQPKSRSLQDTVQTLEAELAKLRQQHHAIQLRAETIHAQEVFHQQERQRLEHQIQQHSGAIAIGQAQLKHLEEQLLAHDLSLQQHKAALAELEQSSTHSRWQQAQEALGQQEAVWQSLEQELRSRQQNLVELSHQEQRTQEKIQQRHLRIQELRGKQTELINRTAQAQSQERQIASQIQLHQQRLSELELALSNTREERDEAHRVLQQQQRAQQQYQWQLQKHIETVAEITNHLSQIQHQLAQIVLPEPCPEIPEHLTLEQLQNEQRRLQKRLQALEPVNMMAIAEYDVVTDRLTELSDRLETLNQERTELLIRIENFTTLRQRAFMQAFDVVNQNFKTIFAELSDGDGYLQLEYPQAPLSGGLNLVAHPKGKPVQHLSSMSGGEKSLTALSFIFALQRYRPSPFYAFDEVDMFLDGANVERLSRMVQQQAMLAQFIVVSLRRPMIEAADRTIGVTQARGAHTQVLGLELRPSPAL
jgi:chromosome segregation protein